MPLTSARIKLEVLSDPDALAERVAAWLLELARAKSGAFAMALSGGSTPKALYHKLAARPYRDLFPWCRTHLFWGDERFVPHGNPLSNYRMVDEALISNVPIPAENVHAVPVEGLTPDEAARAYEGDLKAFYGAESLDLAQPLFDATLLGLGPDGHTASLFPNTDVLKDQEHWVAAVVGVKSEARITLTYPALESSRNTAFLIAGEEKRAIFARLLEGDETLPAGRLRPQGALRVFVDDAVIECGE
jgi:6-phosphogluconolactonase